MRISLDGLSKERAIDIYEWLLDSRAQMFFDQLIITENYSLEAIIRDPDVAFEQTERIKALRAIPEYISYLKDFISEGVTGEENKKIIVDT
jgi:hypothetical protein